MFNHHSRRAPQSLALVSAGLLALALAACGSSEDASTSTIPLKAGESPLGQQLTGKHRGGTLTVYEHEDFEHFDPGEAYGGQDYTVLYAIERPLYSYPPNTANKLVPDVAAAAPVIAAITGGAWILWSVAYFAFFWSSTGQTPGNRVMGIRVVDAGGSKALRPRRALLRFVGLVLAAIPLLAGFWMMLWDERRRCLQDRLARTLVLYEPEELPFAALGAEVGANTTEVR